MAGKDTVIRIYDEQTKSLAQSLKALGDCEGHSNRIFCLKFNPYNPNLILSGGWDNTVVINDLREKGPVL